jgi:hypothetical protein
MKNRTCSRCGGRRSAKAVKEGKPCTRCNHVEARPRGSDPCCQARDEARRDSSRARADEAYWQHRQRIAGQLNDIREALNKHGDRQSRARGDWGFPGDMGHTTGALQEILDFLQRGNS